MKRTQGQDGEYIPSRGSWLDSDCRLFKFYFILFLRYEHSKPLKQEEATATDLTAKSPLAASSSLSSVVGPIVEMNMGEAESRNSNFSTVGAGSEDWVNAIEFVPGQPYCGRSEYFAVLGLRFCARAFSSCGKRGPLFIAVRGPLTIAASLAAEHRLQKRRLSNCGSRA